MSLAHDRLEAGKNGPYRVMVVDDSAVVRGLLTRILEADPTVSVLATASNGEQALRLLGKHEIEVVVLDIEMPVMDGLTVLPRILAINPRIKVIMASTLTRRNAQISFQALAAGAADYIPKPLATRDITTGDDFKRELRDKVKALAQAYRGTTAPAGLRPSASAPAPASGMERTLAPSAHRPLVLRNSMGKQAAILAIGSSTGGPQALLALLKELGPAIQLPIVITQHLPPTFTTILAEHITRASGHPCAEAEDGEMIEPGKIYLAPGNWHMIVEPGKAGMVLRLHQQPPVNFCRPAVDPLFESVAHAYDGRVLAVVLTGMGHDGLNGGREIIRRGGTVIAQDEETSVVWGMPGAVAMAGICNAVLPLDQLPRYIRDFPQKATP